MIWGEKNGKSWCVENRREDKVFFVSWSGEEKIEGERGRERENDWQRYFQRIGKLKNREEEECK